MVKNLVIVESPHKAKTIGKFLGPDFTVMSSYGHIRDLRKKNFSLDKDKGFDAPTATAPSRLHGSTAGTSCNKTTSVMAAHIIAPQPVCACLSMAQNNSLIFCFISFFCWLFVD